MSAQVSERTASASYQLYECQPSSSQEMLLHAALDGGESALAAWQAWRSSVALDDVDPASFRLLPLAYKNLSALGVVEPPMDRIKGVYRYTWMKNQALYRSTGEVIQLFGEQGIPSLLLKGMALATRYYAVDGVRAMQDIDLLVPPELFRRATELLLAAGWEPFNYSPRALDWYHARGFMHACGFRKNGIELDLHMQLFRFITKCTDDLWQAAEPSDWRGLPVRRLCDTDQLFHTCVHGVRWSYGFLCWIPDALAILGCPDTRIEWPRLLRLAALTRTSVYLYNALAYLKQGFAAPIPEQVLGQLRDQPCSWLERQEHRTFASNQPDSFSIAARRALFLAARYQASSAGRPGPIAFSPTGFLRFAYVHVRGVLL